MWKQTEQTYKLSDGLRMGEDLFLMRRTVRQKIAAVMKERGLKLRGNWRRRCLRAGEGNASQPEYSWRRLMVLNLERTIPGGIATICGCRVLEADPANTLIDPEWEASSWMACFSGPPGHHFSRKRNNHSAIQSELHPPLAYDSPE
jgi:hypothetical protein